jgi:hypothetical protein
MLEWISIELVMTHKVVTKMPSETKIALAALRVFCSASAVLAGTNSRTDHHGSVADALWAVNPAVKPLTAEETTWFVAPQLALLQSAPFCLKSASGAANCTYHTLILCEQAKHPNSLDQCIPRWKVS